MEFFSQHFEETRKSLQLKAIQFYTEFDAQKLISDLQELDVDALPWKEIVLGFSFFLFLWSTYLDYRQHRKLLDPKMPAAVKKITSQETFDKARLYGLDKSRFAFFSSTFEQVKMTLMFTMNFLPWAWNYSAELLQMVGIKEFGEIYQSCVFMSLYIVISMVTSLPLSLYSTFVIEERHGFNKQTLSLFISDTVKGLILSLVIGLPVLSAVISIIQWTGKSFYVYVWAFMFVFQIFLITLYPTVIQPLFNKFETLADGKLKEGIDALADRVKFPLTKVFVMDGSKRSSHSNAYFFGFFKNKRIVLFDTLVEQNTQEEILAVLAHELGHWHFNHVFSRLCIIQAQLFVVFYLFGFFIDRDSFFAAFDFETKPILIGFLLFSSVYTPADALMSLFLNVLSRYNEFQADAFAVKLGYAKTLSSGLIKLHIKNLGNMNPDRLYSVWHYSHPPLVERLAAIGDEEKKRK